MPQPPSRARLILTALFVDRQTPAEVAARYGVFRAWVDKLKPTRRLVSPTVAPVGLGFAVATMGSTARLMGRTEMAAPLTTYSPHMG
jgi:hypothetical protein